MLKHLTLSLFLTASGSALAQTQPATAAKGEAKSPASSKASSGQSLSLRQCIDRAIARNVSVRQAELTRQQQLLAVDAAKHARLPEVGANASQNASLGRGLTANNTYDTRNTYATSFGINAGMPLYTGYRIGNERKRAELNLRAATADIERLRENLGIQVAQSYFQVIYQQELLAQAQTNLQLSQLQERRLSGLIKEGKAAQVELAEAQSRVTQDEASIVQQQSQYNLALLELSQLLEFSTPDSLHIASPATQLLPHLPESADAVYALALPQRPALEVAHLRKESALMGIKVAKAGYLPTLSLSAGLGSNYYNTSGFRNDAFTKQLRNNLAGSLSLSLSIPIFDRFTTRNNVKQAKLEVLNQQLEEENLKKSLYKEIQNAYYNAVAAQQKWTAAQTAEKASEVTLNLVTKKYEAGKANGTEYDEARTKHTTAVTQRLTAFYDYLFRTKILDFYAGEPLQ